MEEKKSLIELAYDVVANSKAPIAFKALWKAVVKAKGLTEEEAAEKVGQFYTNLLLDGRFVNLGDNVWDLRIRHKFEKVHIDMKDVYSDVEATDSDDKEEETEEKEYNEVFEEKVISRDDEIESEEPLDEDGKSDEDL